MEAFHSGCHGHHFLDEFGANKGCGDAGTRTGAEDQVTLGRQAILRLQCA
jgi:hypothetical protein